MHYVTAKSILSANHGMNLYRGCAHGCIYCDARSTCYHMEHEFEDIEIKENAIPLLEQVLKKKRKRCMIGTGAMSDPYVPLEMQTQYMRKALQLIDKYGFGIAVQTKSNRILRDMDLLKKINEQTKCVVQMTLTTYDDGLCQKIEPNVCPTSERVSVLKQMRDEGIPTVVWLSPILPFINDTEENISGLLEMCREARVYGVICFGMGLTLREGSREYFYSQLDRLFPGLRARYVERYGEQYMVGSPNHPALMKLFQETCERYGIVHDNDKIFRYMRQFEEKNMPEQMSLWDL